MAKTLYLECYSGISGDMTVGALLDLGADQRLLEEQLRSLPVSGFEIEISRVKKSGLDACDFRVILDKEHENHDHDNEYLYGHGHKHEHEHHHHHAHTHDHIHRGLPEIREIILHSGITERAKKTALAIFQVLAEAEAKAHGTAVEEVHFHEVGAVDSVVDIVAAAVCLDNLAVDEVIVPELYEGRGTVRCQHGIIPVPVPAVVHIAGEHGITLHMTDTEAELVTPTGAAIVAAVLTADRLHKMYTILRNGKGARKRDYGRASIHRGMLIEPDTEEAADFVYKLESNIDDCTGEALGYVMDRLFEAGARDVNYIPVYMKKNRPAYQLNVLCSEETVPRIVRMERTVMRREIRTLATSLGEAKVKVCRLGCSDIIRVYPEYESAADISREKKLPYQDVWRQLQKEACEQIEKCYE